MINHCHIAILLIDLAFQKYLDGVVCRVFIGPGCVSLEYIVPASITVVALALLPLYAKPMRYSDAFIAHPQQPNVAYAHAISARVTILQLTRGISCDPRAHA